MESPFKDLSKTFTR